MRRALRRSITSSRPVRRAAAAILTLASLTAMCVMAPSMSARAADTTPAERPATTDTEATRPSLDARALDDLIRARLAQPDLEGTTISVLIETYDGDVLYERRPDRPMIPASNMKIVTGACSLSTLGPDYRFETDAGATAGLVDGVLSGDLFVRGGGDPSLVSEELWNICDGVRSRGIRRIEGDIVLDASRFDTLLTATHDADEGDRAYDARTGALSLNFNTVAVHVYPGNERGDDAVVTLSPECGFVELRNRARTGPSNRGSTIEVRRSFDDGHNVVTVTGRMPEGAPGRTFYRNLDDPEGCFGAAMRDFLARAGVEVAGDVREGPYPEDAWPVHRHRSKALSLIVRDLGKYSNNFAAEQLLKTMSAELYGAPGTTAGGTKVLSGYLRKAGVDSGAFRIVDGSGLSRDDRLTTRALVSVIRSMLADFETSYEFVASLSVSGVDGTLSDRMDFPGLRASVRAKTGLLDGVTAISGVLHTVAGDDVVFSIITNGFSCEAWRLHDVEHEILAHVARTLPPLGVDR